MKPRDVHREITPRQSRSGGEGPNIGRVSRLRGTDNGDGLRPRRRRVSRETSASNTTLKFWSMVLGGVAFAVIVAAVFLWLKPMMGRKSAPARTSAGTMELESKMVSKFPSPSRDEAIRLVKEATANRQTDKVGQYFRMGTSTPEQIVAYCAATDLRDGPVLDYEWLSNMDSDGMLVEGVVVNHKGAEKTNQRLALLTPDESGRWRVDFDAFARTVTPSWDEVLEKGAEKALVRVMSAPDVYYNGPFLDEAVWKCYAMSSPDNEELLRGYCRLGTRQAEVMEKLFRDGARSARVTLEIRRLPDAERKQFEITHVLGTEWIIAGGGS